MAPRQRLVILLTLTWCAAAAHANWRLLPPLNVFKKLPPRFVISRPQTEPSGGSRLPVAASHLLPSVTGDVQQCQQQLKPGSSGEVRWVRGPLSVQGASGQFGPCELTAPAGSALVLTCTELITAPCSSGQRPEYLLVSYDGRWKHGKTGVVCREDVRLPFVVVSEGPRIGLFFQASEDTGSAGFRCRYEVRYNSSSVRRGREAYLKSEDSDDAYTGRVGHRRKRKCISDHSGDYRSSKTEDFASADDKKASEEGEDEARGARNSNPVSLNAPQPGDIHSDEPTLSVENSKSVTIFNPILPSKDLQQCRETNLDHDSPYGLQRSIGTVDISRGNHSKRSQTKIWNAKNSKNQRRSRSRSDRRNRRRSRSGSRRRSRSRRRGQSRGRSRRKSSVNRNEHRPVRWNQRRDRRAKHRVKVRNKRYVGRGATPSTGRMSGRVNSFGGALPSDVKCGVSSNTSWTGATSGRTEIEDYPWMAALRPCNASGDCGFCGGALIAARWVLTAAHCIKNASRVTLRLGSTLVNRPTLELTATRLIHHPAYDRETLLNDIGLVELPQPVSFSDQVRPICLPRLRRHGCRQFAGAYARVSGWGRSDVPAVAAPQPERSSISPFLRDVRVPILDNSECVWNPPTSQLCVSTAGGESACRGDSGGPLQVRLTDGTALMVGVVSYGALRGCQLGAPVAFSRVTSYLPFIASVTGLDLV